MSIIKIKKDNDPFKKYWWAILLGFVGVGAWVCVPLMGDSIGSRSGSVRAPGLSTANQSLDSMANPSGAPGSAYDLSMDDAYGKKKTDGEAMSALYQAPPDAETGAAAPGSPVTGAGAAAASFADALKKVSSKTALASWGGAKPQAGFTAPKGNFSSLTGLGSSSGGSGASSGPTSVGAFGSNTAKTGVTTTRGLGSGGSAAGGLGAKPIMGALQGAASQGQLAVMNRSGDAARVAAGASFDGGRAGSSLGGGPTMDLGGGTYAGLDAAPANFKVNDPNANSYKADPVPGQFAAPAQNQTKEMEQAIMMMVVSAVVGGVVTGVVGSVFGAGASAVANPMVQAYTNQVSQQNAARNLPSYPSY
jgi:hypothetical protein